MVDKDLDEKLKRIYPEGRSLDVDREFTAETVFDPSKPGDIEKWKDRRKRSDLRGFDTRSGKEKSVKSVIRDIAGGDINYIADFEEGNQAPDKFVDASYRAGELLKSEKDKITDYESLKEIVNKQWLQDEGLRNLVPVLKEKDYLSLYKHSIIQSYINNNIQPVLINYISKKYNVEPIKASKIFHKLSGDLRQKLFRTIKRKQSKQLFKKKEATDGDSKLKDLIQGRKPSAEPRKTSKKKKKKAIGTTGSGWVTQEENFIKVNRNLPPEKLHRAYNNVFGRKRSLRSIQSKLKSIRDKYGKK